MTSEPEPTAGFRYATRADVARIVALDRRYLPAETIVDETVFESWRRRNRAAFTVLLIEGAVRGYFSLLPLVAGALDRFVAGKITENRFTGDDIVSEGDVGSVPSALYLYSIVIDDRSRTALAETLTRLAGELRRYDALTPVQRVYATAATPAGRGLLERLGFRFVMARAGRADDHDLYALDGNALERLLRLETITT